MSAGSLIERRASSQCPRPGRRPGPHRDPGPVRLARAVRPGSDRQPLPGPGRQRRDQRVGPLLAAAVVRVSLRRMAST